MIASTLTAMATLMVLAQGVPGALATLQAAPVEAAPAPAVQAEPTVDTPTQQPLAGPVAQPGEDAAEASQPSALPPNATPIAEPVTTPQTDPAPTQPQLTPLQQARILDNVAASLAAARTADGSFTQVNADGSVMTGTFALRRPGRMRFDYDDPTPILIVSDGTTVAMEDSELETVDRVPLSSTPLGLILNDQLDFQNDVDVLRVAENAERTLVTVEDKTGEVDGELTMVFVPGSYLLQGWITIDANLQMTRVELSDVTTNGRIDPRLFRLDEPDDEEDER